MNPITKHFHVVDPLLEHRNFTYQFMVVLALSVFIYIYWQPPYPFFILFVPLLHALPCFFFYTLKDKLKAKLIIFLFFSISLIVLTIFKPTGILLALVVFILSLFIFMVNYFGPIYRAIASVAMVLTFSSLFMPFGWYGAVSIIIEVAIVLVISIVVDLAFIPYEKNFVTNACKSACVVFLDRLILCQKALKNECPINQQAVQDTIIRDMVIRNHYLRLTNIQNQQSVFDPSYLTLEVKMAIIHLRQSLYALMQSVDMIIADDNTDKPFALEIIRYLSNKTAQWLLYLHEKIHGVSFSNINSLKWQRDDIPDNMAGFFITVKNYETDLNILLKTIQNAKQH